MLTAIIIFIFTLGAMSMGIYFYIHPEKHTRGIDIEKGRFKTLLRIEMGLLILFGGMGIALSISMFFEAFGNSQEITSSVHALSVMVVSAAIIHSLLTIFLGPRFGWGFKMIALTAAPIALLLVLSVFVFTVDFSLSYLGLAALIFCMYSLLLALVVNLLHRWSLRHNQGV